MNYAALGEITQLSSDASFFSAATATDNLFSAVFLSVLALLPGWRWLARRFTAHEHGEEQVVMAEDAITSTSLTLALATAITTILGLMPMVLGVNLDLIHRQITVGSPSSQWWTQLASSVAGGLAFATVLTLFLTPSLLMVQANAIRRWKDRRAVDAGRAASSTP